MGDQKRERPKATNTGGLLLPPPPGGVRTAAAPVATQPAAPMSGNLVSLGPNTNQGFFIPLVFEL